MWFTQSHAVLRTSVDLSSVMRVLFYLLAIVTVTVLRDRESRVADSRSVENSGAKAQGGGNSAVAAKAATYKAARNLQ
jgi:hypothetical protein